MSFGLNRRGTTRARVNAKGLYEAWFEAQITVHNIY
jgi:hypothetical protein